MAPAEATARRYAWYSNPVWQGCFGCMVYVGARPIGNLSGEPLGLLPLPPFVIDLPSARETLTRVTPHVYYTYTRVTGPRMELAFRLSVKRRHGVKEIERKKVIASRYTQLTAVSGRVAHTWVVGTSKSQNLCKKRAHISSF